MNSANHYAQVAARRRRRSPEPRPTRLLLGALLASIGAFAVLAVPRFWHGEDAAVTMRGGAEAAVAELERRLASTPKEKQRALLVRQADRAESPGMRYAAVDRLGERSGPEVADALERAFRDNASSVRLRAVEALPAVDPERGARRLLAALRDDDAWVREAAATQIVVRAGRQGSAVDRRAVPALITALDDPNATVRVLAAAALRKLTGKPWRLRPSDGRREQSFVRERWCRWWRTAASAYQAVPAGFTRPAVLSPARSDPAPAFVLPDVDGREISRAGQRGRITLLNFWGTWCPPCRKEVPDLAKLNAWYRGRGVDVIGIAVGEKAGAEGLRRWTRAHGADYRQALATDAIREAFDIEEVPVSILLDRAGRIRYRWEGERDFATFRRAVERLLREAAQEPPAAATFPRPGPRAAAG